MKDKIKYYLLLLAFLFIMALILWFFHDWIEQYSNSLMVLITFIYVVATIEICRANIKSAEATKEQLEESKHQFAENERLQMMPYFEIIVHDTIDYINSEILQYEYSFNQFVDVLFALSARPNHPLNAKNAFNFFHGVKMSDRDATFIPIFDELYSNHDSALYRLVEWGLVHASKQAITDDIAESCAIILSIVFLRLETTTSYRFKKHSH